MRFASDIPDILFFWKEWLCPKYDNIWSAKATLSSGESNLYSYSVTYLESVKVVGSGTTAVVTKRKTTEKFETDSNSYAVTKGQCFNNHNVIERIKKSNVSDCAHACDEKICSGFMLNEYLGCARR